MTIEIDTDASTRSVVTEECGLCGAEIPPNYGMCNHVRQCPARRAFAPVGALHEVGLEDVRAAIRAELADLARADGGTPECARCGTAVADPQWLLQADGDHEPLCSDCERDEPERRLYRPASDAGRQTTLGG